MPEKPPQSFWKRRRKWIIVGGAAFAIVAFMGVRAILKRRGALPEGIVAGNGRIEGKLVDVSAKEPLRVKQILVEEGAMVKPGQVVARLDTTTLEAELAEATAAIDAAQERLAFSKASIVKQRSEIKLAEVEVTRSERLVAQGAGSQRELDVRRSKLETTQATLAEAEAMLQTSTQRVEVAKAGAKTIQTRIDDATLRSPVTGRVLYRLAEGGEVLAPGGKAVTLVNLEDIYMEIFLPSKEAAALKVGAEGRITVDYDKRAVAGYVSFVSPEAQFTPKQVETKSEREKLMFRVKIQLPKELASQYVDRIKTGVRGVGYVKTKDSAVWPKRLQNLVPDQDDRPGPLTFRPLAMTASPSFAADAPVVSIQGVTHRYGKVVALDGISLDIPRGIMVGIVGPGRRRQVDADGARRRRQEDAGGERSSSSAATSRDIRHRRAVGPRIAYMPQGLGKNLYLELSVYDNVDFLARLFGLPPSPSAASASRSCWRRRAWARSPTGRPASSRAA